MQTEEIWRPIAGHDGYEVSNLGQVRSVDRIIADKNGKRKKLKGRILATSLQGKRREYAGTNLGLGTHYAVHVLVCEAFNGRRPSPKYEVAHEDGNPLNNIASNLRWSLKLENENDKIKHGTRTFGEDHGPAKLKEQQVINILKLYANNIRPVDIARMTGVACGNVYVIVNRKSWKHLTP